jgi:hypothetical protein
MHLSLQSPAQLFFRALSVSPSLVIAALVSRWHARAAEAEAEEAIAALPPHLLSDIGVLTAEDERPDLRSVPAAEASLLPPVSAMHRRGDWGAAQTGKGAVARVAYTKGSCWTWPART